MTKRRQSANYDSNISKNKFEKINKTLIKSEILNVEKLNLLIKTIDRGWVVPKPNSREPVGSNFQVFFD